MNYDELLKVDPYGINKEEKKIWISTILKDLTEHHYKSCLEYKKILDAFNFNIEQVKDYTDIPFLPVRLFKKYNLKSIDDKDIIKTLTSSGTTGQEVSKIFLDKRASTLQTKMLTKLVANFIGKARMPMIILDTSAVIKNRAMFSARGAGIIGFSIFAKEKIFAFDENMELNIEGLKAFLDKYKEQPIFLFGFTFMIWEYFYKKLLETEYRPDLSKGILIHGGGWKKLIDSAVTREEFHKKLNEVCGINHIYDYYGMVEQTGTIYIECEHGNLHTSVFSDICVRRPNDFSIAPIGEKGLLEVVSILPYSYPGHILLTEDEGAICGEDDCPCGRLGKYFKIFGRIKNAEIRGCSDTYGK
ncbi:acyl-protein synthetase [Candidatus Epulonipiscioides gigas]|nr:acyl-protein synthetase [Epulopiscium sp. SCG-C07WGA-EpuloA2]